MNGVLLACVILYLLLPYLFFSERLCKPRLYFVKYMVEHLSR